MKQAIGRMLVCIGVLIGAPAQAATLWYNGDADGVNGLSNEINTSISQAQVYDDFNVPAGGWTINSIWSNNQMDFEGATQATWSIRSGVSVGNGGTEIFGGVDAATQVATGQTFFGLDEYTIEVAGLNIFLSPGPYWLSVTPHDAGAGRSFNSTTSGLNAVGSPAGNNDNSFFDSTDFLAIFEPASTFMGTGNADFSMGIAGEGGRVPEPATLALLGLGLAGLGFSRRRKQR